MTKERQLTLHRIYHVLVSASISIAGICLILSCIAIYRSGDSPYSREVVATAFSRIAFPVYLCLALVIAGFLLNLCFPLPPANLKAKPSAEYTLKRLYSRADLTCCDATVRDAVLREQKSRRLHILISAALLIAGSAIFLAYALNFTHFHPTEMNASMVNAMKLLIPCISIPFAYLVFTTYYQEKSIRRELELIKQAIADGAKKEPAPAEASLQTTCSHRNHLILAVRCVILIAAFGLMLVGILSGGMADVLAKAINICTECIGLG